MFKSQTPNDTIILNNLAQQGDDLSDISARTALRWRQCTVGFTKAVLWATHLGMQRRRVPPRWRQHTQPPLFELEQSQHCLCSGRLVRKPLPVSTSRCEPNVWENEEKPGRTVACFSPLSPGKEITKWGCQTKESGFSPSPPSPIIIPYPGYGTYGAKISSCKKMTRPGRAGQVYF